MATSVVAQQRRSWNVGDTASFPFRVVDASGAAIALLPGSPTYAIISPSGLQVETGPVQALPTPGNFTISWVIPLQSELSTPNTPWRVIVYITTARRHEKELEFTFDVINRTVDNTEKQDVVEAVLAGQNYRAMWRGDADPDQLNLQCYFTKSPGTGQDPVPTLVDKSQMRRAVQGLDVVYYYDIPASAFAAGTQSYLKNQFTLIWVSRDTPSSEQMTQYKQLRVMKLQAFDLVAGVRMMIDRFQHKLGSAYYISDGDICESLDKGLGLLNGWFPVTDPPYSDSLVPESLKTYWVMLSCWWMLSSQHMLAGTLSFNFCVDEDTWVRTEAGLYKIKHLNDGQRYFDYTVDSLWAELKEELLGNGDAFKNSQEVFDALVKILGVDLEDKDSVEVCQSLSVIAANAHADIPERKEQIVPNQRLDTPLGVQTPSVLWDLGYRDVYKVVTEEGFEVTGTHNHPILLLQEDVRYRQTTLDEIAEGDYIAVNVQAEPDKAYDLKLPVLDELLTGPLTEDGLRLPEVMSTDLANVLAYRVTPDIDIAQFYDHLRGCFSRVFNVDVESDTTDAETAAVVRFFRSLGDIDIVGQPQTAGVPWSVMAASKAHAAAFLQTLFDTAGMFVQGEPTFVPEAGCDISLGMLFTGLNPVFVRDLQQLLLRFGVVSTHHGVGPLLITGADVDTYAQAVGFRTRGSSYKPDGFPRPEAAFLHFILQEFHEHMPHSLCTDVDSISTRGGLERFLQQHGRELELLSPDVHKYCTELVADRFRWCRVKSAGPAGKAHVYDPTLPIVREGGLPHELTNLFYTNSIVSHNSGQSISLDQDLTGTIDAAISRLVDWLNTHLGNAKLALYRRSASVAALGIRPYRIVGPNARTYKMDSSQTGSVGGPPNLQAVAQILGILS